ncbi:MAG: hypothetical protein ACOC41_03795 [Chitinivibrionales bacterium]
MKFLFEGDNISAISAPRASQVISLLDTLHPKHRAFFSLTELYTGCYVQVAGARLRLTVEARKFQSKNFRHYVFGVFPRDERGAYINCRVGPITIYKSQMLVLNDAKKIFLHFLRSGELVDGFDLQDVTARFIK